MMSKDSLNKKIRITCSIVMLGNLFLEPQDLKYMLLYFIINPLVLVEGGIVSDGWVTVKSLAIRAINTKVIFYLPNHHEMFE